MRDLRAKLRQQEDNEPILWNPTDGDILVGTLGGDSSLAAEPGTPPIVTVQEERTGIEVLVSLKSPQLAALFELHRPQPGERIGIKCVSCSSAGERQFIVVMDRDATTAAPEPAHEICAQPQPAADDDWETATPEERDYIERMLWGDPTETQAPRSYEVHASRRIEGMIGRGLDELDQQTRAIERLQALIVPPGPATNTVAIAATEPVEAATASADQVARPARDWLGTAVIITCILVAAGAGSVLRFVLPN